jgi:hypothetical protein
MLTSQKSRSVRFANAKWEDLLINCKPHFLISILRHVHKNLEEPLKAFIENRGLPGVLVGKNWCRLMKL